MNRRVLLALAIGALGILAWERAGGDLWVAHVFGSAQGFPWRDRVLTRVVLHDGGRWAAALALAVWAAWTAWAGPSGTRPDRRQRWRAWSLTLGLMLLVPILKRWSLASCPWDLTLFGGEARYESHWGLWWPGAGDGGPGHCFPAGHAVTGFAFLPGLWMWWHYDRCKAYAWGAGACTFGAIMSWAQTVRGAHFVSHHLWTAWLCWAICVVLSPWLAPATAGGCARPKCGYACSIPQTFDRA